MTPLRKGELTDAEIAEAWNAAVTERDKGKPFVEYIDFMRAIATAAYEKATQEAYRRAVEICNERANDATKVRALGNILIRARELEALDCAAAIEREAENG